MKKIPSHKQIGEFLDKSESTIKGWKKKQPVLLEFVQVGAFCKELGLSIERIEQLLELEHVIKGVSTPK